MKRNLKFGFKIGASALVIACMLGVTACSSSGNDENATCILLTRDGKIQSSIVESFEQSYYDKEELQQTILSEAATYNKSAGNGNITVEKVEVKNGTARVQMTYAEPEDYAAFNQTDFFVGTADEAQADGYDLNVVLSSVKNSSETVGKADILGMKDVKLLITDINDAVTLNGRVVYVSENVTVSENAKTIQRTPDSEKKAYVIFK